MQELLGQVLGECPRRGARRDPPAPVQVLRAGSLPSPSGLLAGPGLGREERDFAGNAAPELDQPLIQLQRGRYGVGHPRAMRRARGPGPRLPGPGTDARLPSGAIVFVARDCGRCEVRDACEPADTSGGSIAQDAEINTSLPGCSGNRGPHRVS